MVEEWEKDHEKPNPYEMDSEVQGITSRLCLLTSLILDWAFLSEPTQAEVRKQLLEEETAEALSQTMALENLEREGELVSATEFIVMGLEIETIQ